MLASMGRWLPVLLVLLAGCGDDHSFRAVFIADTHVIGPQYVCCSESEGIDNDSIMKTEERLAVVIDRINHIDPAPDVVFVLGDVTHNPYYSDQADWYSGRDTAFSDAQDLFAALEVPVHFAWGNHDYDVDCDGSGLVDQAFSHDLFGEFFATEPYHAVDFHGWRFVLANSQLGPTWQPGDPLCDTGMASYGREQLAWIDQELAEGLPTTVMFHYPMVVTQEDEDPDRANRDLVSVLDRYAASNLELTLAGHTHRWLDWGDTYAFPHYIIGSTRYDADNFLLIEFDPDGPSYQILDYDKGRRLSTCAENWLYDGSVRYNPDQPQEDGDCE